MRIALLDLVRRPKHRAVMNGDKVIRIVTGLGNNSEGGEAVIKVSVRNTRRVSKTKKNHANPPVFLQDRIRAEIRFWCRDVFVWDLRVEDSMYM